MVGSCNGIICVHLYPHNHDELRFILWNPSIQKYISLPQLSFSEAADLNVGFEFDSRTNDYKLLIVGVDKDGSWIQSYLFSLNENYWKRVNAFSTNYDFLPVPLHFVNGLVHWSGFRCLKKNRVNYSLHYDIDGFGKFEQLQFPPFARMFDSCNELICIQLYPYDNGLKFLLWNPLIKKYIYLPQLSFREADDSNIRFGFDSVTNDCKLLAVGVDKDDVELELWVMKEYSVIESWTKVLTLQTATRYAWFPRVESLVLLDKAVNVHSESDINHPIVSSDSNESGELTLTDSLVAVVGIIAHKVYGDVRMTDTCARETGREVYCHNNTDIFPKKSIAAVVVVNLAEEMGKVGPNSSPSFAAIREEWAILHLSCQQIEPHGVEVGTGLISICDMYVGIRDKGVDVPV
ncbi:hypothetical protein V6N12_042190 [Hibiscus sabdariffa]|uniref:F-box associated domain-containing protein n=1 Tax=Hibiscus sabdariffa TaxID=183260 RepID=A0ABR2EFR6_9ROSI